MHTCWLDLSKHISFVSPVDASFVEHGSMDASNPTTGPLAFDNSKVHYAFTYAQDEERIILIVDFIRPSNIPPGTATGGHTEELDAFIQSVS
eukprot:scaffold28238_cov28-Attheya_sp.AAC.1